MQSARNLLVLLASSVWLISAHAASSSQEPCPRPPPGSAVPEPEDLRSRDGVLRVEMSVRNSRQSDGSVRYCYVLPDGAQSPTLRLRPGDLLVLHLKNELVDWAGLPAAGPQHHHGTSCPPIPATAA